MSVGAWTVTDGFRTKVAKSGFDDLTASGDFKLALLQSTSNIGASSTSYAGLTGEVANGNGYVTGGVAVTLVASGTQVVTLTPSADIVFTASGGEIVARTAVIYQASDDVVAYCSLALLGSTPVDVTVADGEPLTISNTTPVLTFG